MKRQPGCQIEKFYLAPGHFGTWGCQELYPDGEPHPATPLAAQHLFFVVFVVAVNQYQAFGFYPELLFVTPKPIMNGAQAKLNGFPKDSHPCLVDGITPICRQILDLCCLLPVYLNWNIVYWVAVTQNYYKGLRTPIISAPMATPEMASAVTAEGGLRKDAETTVALPTSPENTTWLNVEAHKLKRKTAPVNCSKWNAWTQKHGSVVTSLHEGAVAPCGCCGMYFVPYFMYRDGGSQGRRLHLGQGWERGLNGVTALTGRDIAPMWEFRQVLCQPVQSHRVLGPATSEILEAQCEARSLPMNYLRLIE
ncbi:hypothetical protein B0H19DRAFT_1058498 [Mycena capillaripes]|nr:hypothetical protein B0H19DRAFT_1058498 [Mycena capillaripes]